MQSMQPSQQIRRSVPAFRKASFPAHLRWQTRASCLPPVAITAVPDGKLHAPYFMQWSFGIEHQFGNTGSVQAQYVGHSRRGSTLSHAGQRIPDGVPGMLCSVPLHAANRSAIRCGDPAFDRRQQQLQRPSTDRHETLGTRPARAGQLHLEPLPRRGLQRRFSAVLLSRNSLSSAGRARPQLRPPATTTSATTSPRSMCMNCRSK